MARRSGSAAGSRGWVAVLLRVFGPVPLLVFLGLAAWSVFHRSGGWLYGLVVGVIGAMSYVPVAISTYEGRYDPS